MIEHFYNAILPGLGVLAATPRSHAQTADHKIAIGLPANATQYRGDLGNAFRDFRNMPYSGGLGITRYVGRMLDIKLTGRFREKCRLATSSYNSLWIW